MRPHERVGLRKSDGLAQGVGQRPQRPQGLRRGGVEVEVRGRRKRQLMRNAVKSGIDQQGVGQIGVGGGVGGAQLRAALLPHGGGYSPLAAGMRISWERFSSDQVM